MKAPVAYVLLHGARQIYRIHISVYISSFQAFIYQPLLFAMGFRITNVIRRDKSHFGALFK
jgi:hypothetical protein